LTGLAPPLPPVPRVSSVGGARVRGLPITADAVKAAMKA
jgi:hypothetical protein